MPDSLLRRIGWHAGLILAARFLLAPVVVALLASFKPADDVFSDNPLPTRPTLANYHTALGRFPLGRLLINTFVTSAGVMAAQLVVAALGAYALVRMGGSVDRLILAAGTVSILIPTQALIIPQFVIVTHLGWLNSYAGLIVPQLCGTGVALVLLRQHVTAIPDSLTEAALLDGATTGQTLWYVVLPLLCPALSAVGVLVFVTTWNEYPWPLLGAPDLHHTTIQLGLALFTNAEGANPGPLLAAATVPVLIGYLLAARRVTDAFLQSGIR